MRTIVFPSTITKTSPAMIRFRFFDSQKPNPDEPTATIVLPSPLALSNNYNVSFDDLEAGLFERALETFIRTTSDIAGVVTSEQSGTDKVLNSVDAITDGAGELIGSLFGGTSLVRRAIGGNLNKRNELVINKPQNRSFNMRFQLVPTNKEEANSIQEIVNTFKIAMHPPTNNELSDTNGAGDRINKAVFFLNPARVKVDFLFRDAVKEGDNFDFSTDNVNRRIFSTSFCFLSNLDVNYHNAGAPSYFSDGQPGNMAFSVQMTEVHPNSREMINRIDLGSRDPFGKFADSADVTSDAAARLQGTFLGDFASSSNDFLGQNPEDDRSN